MHPSVHHPSDGILVNRRTLLAGAAGAALATAPAGTARAGTAPAGTTGTTTTGRATLHRWAADTWRSLAAMTHPATGLPADNITASLAPGDRSGYTSPTNIGGLLWSAVVARELRLISTADCNRIVVTALTTLNRMDHHTPSGMYYNWYDEATGDVLTTWPADGTVVHPFVSSVDNAWLGTALQVVRRSVPAARGLADRLWERMRWDMFYDRQASRPGGLVHGGFYDSTPPDGASVFTGNHIGAGPDVWYTNHHYDTVVSETRITSYLGIVRGQIPARHYFAMWRTFPAGDDYSWQEAQPVGVTRTHQGLDVYEGAYRYRGMRIVPGWGGSMFEELMPALFVPETDWAPQSWAINHRLHVRAQREHGLIEAGYGFWGFSPSSDPAGGYREYGLDALGMNPDGYFSDQQRTNTGTNFGDGVVTPHAAFLAMTVEPDSAYRNLTGIERDLGAYGRGGFFDAVAVGSGTVARRYLSLDQAMVLGALGNVLGDGLLHRAFASPAVERALRPVLRQERFGAGLD